MAKFRPGIPDGFDLNVNVEPVSDLGDYLDEPRPLPRPTKKAAVSTVAPEPRLPQQAQDAATPEVASVTSAYEVGDESVYKDGADVGAPANEDRTEVLEPTETVEETGVGQGTLETRETASAPRARTRPKLPKAPRREISMTPDALDMSDELLEIIGQGSGQRDTKANELFHALVLLAYEVRDELDAYAIPKRGRWGSPTARAYPIEIKNAFVKAILRKRDQDANDRRAAPER